MKRLVFLAFVGMLLVACGGGNSSTNTNSSSNPSTLTGVLLDSAVINVNYKTQTQSGTTNLQGEYQYLADETVTFSIGSLEFPSVEANSTVTILDIAATRIITADSVVNMIRLLQSLDKNNDPLDGIEITDTAKLAATSVNFSQSKSTFAQQTNIANLVSGGGQDDPIATLIPESVAIANFIIGLGRTRPTFTTTSTITAVVNPAPAIGADYNVFCNRASSTSPPNKNVGDTEAASFTLVIDNAQNKLLYLSSGYEEGDVLLGNFTTNNNIVSAILTSGRTYIPVDGFTSIETSNVSLTYNIASGALTGVESATVTNILNRNGISRTCATTWGVIGTRR